MSDHYTNIQRHGLRTGRCKLSSAAAVAWRALLFGCSNIWLHIMVIAGAAICVLWLLLALNMTTLLLELLLLFHELLMVLL